jgi:hypothetical protein
VSACGGGGDGGNGPPTVTSIAISGDSTVVLAGTRQLTATAMSGTTPITSGVTFLWASGDTTKATVSASGVVTGVRRGTSAISAVALVNGVLSTVIGTHNIRTRIGSIAITPTNPQLSSLGDTVLLTAEGRDALNAPVAGVAFTWRTRTAAVAEVTPRANTAQADVVAIGNGSARVIATGDGVSDSGSVTVRQVATTLSLTPASTTLHSVGATLTPTITANDARGNPVAPSALGWTSQSTGVATVSTTTGVITAIDEGQSRVIATSGALADTVMITVDQIPSSITISPANFGVPDVTMRTNQAAPFYATVLDSLGHVATHDSVTWSTTDATTANVSGAATLDSTVITTFALIGSATITATATPVSASRVVNVSNMPISYATDVQTVFDTHCITCHAGASAPEGMSLVAAVSYNNIVEHAAGEVGALKRVRSFRPDSSYLVHKIQGTQGTVGGGGARMPFGCSGASCLDNATINLIRNWILQGAQNN